MATVNICVSFAFGGWAVTSSEGLVYYGVRSSFEKCFKSLLLVAWYPITWEAGRGPL